MLAEDLIMNPGETISRDELKIFFAFLLIFLLFVNWGGDNSWSRFDLTQSIAENRSFNIANNSQNTVDKLAPESVFFEDLNASGFDEVNRTDADKVYGDAGSVYRESKVIYTDKAPLSSFIAVPGYLLADSLTGDGHDTWAGEGISYTAVSLSFSTAFKMLIVTLTTSILAGLLLLVLLYRESLDYVDSDTAFYTAVLTGIATPVLIYSTSFFGVMLAGLFGFSSYIALKKALEKDSSRRMAVAGVLAALAFSTEYYAGIIAIFLTLYLLLEDRKQTIFFLSGAFTGSLPLIFYHWAITGNPLIPPIFYRELASIGPLGRTCSTFIYCYKAPYGFVPDAVRILNATLRLLFYPVRGIFFYSPILLLSIPGIYELYRRDRKKLILFPGIFLAFILFQAARLNWIAGISFGPRYAVVGLPFLLIPVALGLKKMREKHEVWQTVVLVLALISCFNMLLGFTSLEGFDVESDEYQERFTGLKPVQPDFYSDRLDNFHETGPRSELMMSFTDRYKGLDITYRSPYGPSYFELSKLGGTGTLFSTQLLPVMISALILSTILWKKSDGFKMMFLMGITILLFLSISFSDSYIDGEIYQEENFSGAVNGSISFTVHGNDKISYFELVKHSPRDSVNITVLANGEREKSFQLTGRESFNIPPLSEGKNTIRIESDGCTVPALFENSSDTRCVSFGVKTFSLNSSENFKRPNIDGFYGNRLSEKPWMGKQADIIFVPDKENSVLYLDMNKAPFLEKDNLSFELNGEPAATLVKEEQDVRKIYFANETVAEKFNHLEIKSQGCAIPSRNVEDSRDDRCLSYRLTNFSVIPEQNYPNLVFTEGWYERDSRGRWMKSQGEIFARITEPNSTVNLDLDPYKNLEGNTVEIFVNGENRRNVSLSRRKDVMIPIENSEELNRIRIESRKGCIKPSEISSSSDNRCLSVYLRESNITSKTETKYRKGWYLEEEADFGTYRWMSNTSYVVYESTGEDLLDISAQSYEELENNSLKVFADGEQIAELEEGEIEDADINLESKPGISVIRFESSKGCLTPAEVEENSLDQRCLSFRFDRLEIKQKKFESGWHSEESVEDFSYHWMEERSKTRFIGNGEKEKLVMEFKPYKHLEDPVLEVSVNGNRIGSLKLQGPGRVREEIEIPTKKGLNKLELKSLTGCEEPIEHEKTSNDRRCLSFQFNKLEFR